MIDLDVDLGDQVAAHHGERHAESAERRAETVELHKLFAAVRDAYPAGRRGPATKSAIGQLQAVFASTVRDMATDRKVSVAEESARVMPALEAWLRSEQYQSGVAFSLERWVRDALWDDPPGPALRGSPRRNGGHAKPTGKTACYIDENGQMRLG
jgi:hypothetical protein